MRVCACVRVCVCVCVCVCIIMVLSASWYPPGIVGTEGEHSKVGGIVADIVSDSCAGGHM